MGKAVSRARSMLVDSKSVRPTAVLPYRSKVPQTSLKRASAHVRRKKDGRKDILDTHTHSLYCCMEAKFANGEGALAVVLIDLIYL